MANRNKDFNKYVAQEFEDPKFAQAYIAHLINDEGLSLDEALRDSITSMGLQAFASKADVSVSYVSDFVNGRKKWSTDNLIKYIERVFGLETAVIVNAPKAKTAGKQRKPQNRRGRVTSHGQVASLKPA